MLKPVEVAVPASAVVVAGAGVVDPGLRNTPRQGNAHQHLGDLIGGFT
jgi:hypothetical protein